MSREYKIQSKEKDLGDNFIVRRSLPSIEKKMVGPFVFWDHMGPVTLKPGKDMIVRAHPHIGLATITYLFSGEILHRDSLGNEQTIKPGEVNWMTAGSGIVHSERSYAQQPPVELEGIQLWVALPKEAEDVDASFVHEKEKELPLIHENGYKLRLIAGEAFNQKSPLPVYSNLFYLKGEVEAGELFQMNLEPNQEAAIYIINGQVEVETETYQRFDMVTFSKGSQIEFKCLEDTVLMILGGEAFPEKRHVWWNFVSSEKEKIEQAKMRWIERKFPEVINETEFIPLPDK